MKAIIKISFYVFNVALTIISVAYFWLLLSELKPESLNVFLKLSLVHFIISAFLIAGIGLILIFNKINRNEK
jgi:hypothetical protein